MKVKKNLLDLKHNRYLQYFNTLIVILFTYLIGLTIAFLTGEFDYSNYNQLTLLIVLSTGFVGTTLMLMYYVARKIEEVYREIKKLES